MTIQYQGIRRKTTDVLDDYGQAHYLQNVRLKRVGELGRRAGLGKSTMAQLAGPVQFMIGAWSNVPYIVSGTGGTVTGQEDPLSYWTAATMRIPDGQVGQPAAPTINSVTASPVSPQAYVAGPVTFTPNITYDGLSGALIYGWQQTLGPALVTPSSSVASTFATDFTGACTPGTYSFELTVSTTLNGFVAGPFPFSFTVT